MDDASTGDRSRSGGGAGGERPRASTGDVGGGFQRPRTDGSSTRSSGRPLNNAQRTRNASFAMPRMRSPSFLVKEKDEETPDADESPWGVAETEAEEKKESPRELADKQMQTRLTKKLSMSFTNLGSPTSPHQPISPQATSPTTPGTKTVGLGLRKSMSMFGGNKAGIMSPTAASENVAMSAFAGAPGSPTTPSSPQTFENLPVVNSKSRIMKDSDNHEPFPKETDKISQSDGNTNFNAPRKAGQEEAEPPGDAAKSQASHRVRGARHHQGEDIEKNKVKHKKKGLGSKLRSAIGGGKKEEDKVDSSDSDSDDEIVGDGGRGSGDHVSSGGDGAVRENGVLFKDPSLRNDDFVNYQTKPKDEKKWKAGRKSKLMK